MTPAMAPATALGRECADTLRTSASSCSFVSIVSIATLLGTPMSFMACIFGCLQQVCCIVRSRYVRYRRLCSKKGCGALSCSRGPGHIVGAHGRAPLRYDLTPSLSIPDSLLCLAWPWAFQTKLFSLPECVVARVSVYSGKDCVRIFHL